MSLYANDMILYIENHKDSVITYIGKKMDICITIHFAIHLKLTHHCNQLYFNNI